MWQTCSFIKGLKFINSPCHICFVGPSSVSLVVIHSRGRRGINQSCKSEVVSVEFFNSTWFFWFLCFLKFYFLCTSAFLIICAVWTSKLSVFCAVCGDNAPAIALYIPSHPWHICTSDQITMIWCHQPAGAGRGNGRGVNIWRQFPFIWHFLWVGVSSTAVHAPQADVKLSQVMWHSWIHRIVNQISMWSCIRSCVVISTGLIEARTTWALLLRPLC